MPQHTEIQRIAEAALAAADFLLSSWLPDGKRKGKEFWSINPVRGDRSPGSFSINIMTGAWSDFASGDKGGDLVSLLAYLRGCRQMDAARMIAQQLGMTINGDSQKRDFLHDETVHKYLAHQLQQRRQQDEIEQQDRWEQEATRAQRQWGQCKSADPYFPYLARKGIKAHHLRQFNNKLVAPICWRGAVVNLQFIAADSSKRFQKGARISGCYCPFGSLEAGGELYIAEGVATAATLHEETGVPVAAAMSAGNLLSAGRELQRLYPETTLIICGDDDRSKEAESKENRGKTAAIEAARQLSCTYSLPAWPEDAPLHLTDFNDLRLWLRGRA